MKGVIPGVFIKLLATIAGLHLSEKFIRDFKKERSFYLKHSGIKLKKVFIASWKC